MNTRLAGGELFEVYRESESAESQQVASFNDMHWYPLEFSCKQTKVSVSHQNSLRVSLRSVSFIIKHLQRLIFCTFHILHRLCPCLLVGSLLLLCFCWCIAAYFGVLPPPVDQWNNVKPQAGLDIASPPSCTRYIKPTNRKTAP